MAESIENASTQTRFCLSPIVALAVAIAALPAMLLLINTVPIGSMYWDLYIYFDAANRIFSGQVPSVDFFTPVGPLGYWLFAGGLKLFPTAQPLLLVEWSLFVISAPLMAMVVFAVDRDNRMTTYGLLLPYLFFAILPFNVREYYILAGSDGFGIYNRQGAILLYILISALMFVRSQKLLVALVSLSMVALFLIKITGFSVAAMLCVLALLTGRLKLQSSIIAGILFLVVIGTLEIYNGVVSAYLVNIVTLLQHNIDSISPQLASKFAQNFKALGLVVLLIVLLLYLNIRTITDQIKRIFSRPSLNSVARLLDNQAVWLGAVMIAGVLYESQNWGSQDLIYIWPVLLTIIVDKDQPFSTARWRFAIPALAIAAIIPIVMIVAERAVRGWAGIIRNQPLVHQNLKTIGSVSLRPYMLRRAEIFKTIYPDNRQAFEAIAAAEVLPSYTIYSQFKYQIGYLMHIDDAITAIEKLEINQSIRFETMFHISFTNPFPWLMERQAPKHVAIGADPFRAVPKPDERVIKAISETDIALFPTCPVVYTNIYLLKLYNEGLKNHKRITLTPCYDALVHPKLAITDK